MSVAEQKRIDAWEDALRPQRRGVRVDRVGDDIHLSWHMNSGLWARVSLAGITVPGSDGPRTGPFGVHQIRNVDACYPGAEVGLGAISFVGAGWANLAASGRIPDYRRTPTAGDHALWTVPAQAGGGNKTTIVARVVRHSTTHGVMRVSVGGSWTAAIGLPTMQDLVDQGLLTSTSLIANGGTLDPTHRGYSSYSPGTTTLEEFVLGNGFASAQQVRVEYTGAWRPGATGSSQRATLAGFAYSTQEQATTAPLVTTNTLMTRESAWEYATVVGPSVAGAKFSGSFHGNEDQPEFPTVRIDGIDTVLTDGVPVIGMREVVVTKRSTLTNSANHNGPRPMAAGAPMASVETVYTLDGHGLLIAPTITWLHELNVTASYAMMALNGTREIGGQQFTRGVTSDWAGDWQTLPTTIGTDADFAGAESAAAALRSANYVATISMEDYPAWRRQASSPLDRPTVVECRVLSAASSVTKIYMTGIKSAQGRLVAPGDTQKYRTRFMLGYFPGGTASFENI
ncbi:MAG: hypothetical protein ACRCSN_19680 [Dermatophilaceae bacterium]